MHGLAVGWRHPLPRQVAGNLASYSYSRSALCSGVAYIGAYPFRFTASCMDSRSDLCFGMAYIGAYPSGFTASCMDSRSASCSDIAYFMRIHLVSRLKAGTCGPTCALNWLWHGSFSFVRFVAGIPCPSPFLYVL